VALLTCKKQGVWDHGGVVSIISSLVEDSTRINVTAEAEVSEVVVGEAGGIEWNRS
jgi:hypothetical protein